MVRQIYFHLNDWSPSSRTVCSCFRKGVIQHWFKKVFLVKLLWLFTQTKQSWLSAASACAYTKQAGVMESAEWQQRCCWELCVLPCCPRPYTHACSAVWLPPLLCQKSISGHFRLPFSCCIYTQDLQCHERVQQTTYFRAVNFNIYICIYDTFHANVEKHNYCTCLRISSSVVTDWKVSVHFHWLSSYYSN